MALDHWIHVFFVIFCFQIAFGKPEIPKKGRELLSIAYQEHKSKSYRTYVVGIDQPDGSNIWNTILPL